MLRLIRLPGARSTLMTFRETRLPLSPRSIAIKGSEKSRHLSPTLLYLVTFLLRISKLTQLKELVGKKDRKHSS